MMKVMKSLCSTRLVHTQRRLFQHLSYSSYGNPLEVLSLSRVPSLDSDKTSKTKLKVLLAPINPADINTIQGVYPIRPALPAVPGGECVAEVVESDSLNKGDRVIVLELGWGTWKEYGVIEDKYLYKIPSSLSNEDACQLSVNPCTAFRTLKDYVSLKKGDVVIQNGANSSVGQFVIQLCKIWNLKSVNIVRSRPEIGKLKNHLESLGADFVFTEEEFSKGFTRLDLPVPKPRLALNCVGGRSATNLSRSLSNGGYLVTYGGMSRKPLMLSTASFIFTDIRATGFWLSRWKEQNHGSRGMTSMFDELCKLLATGKLKSPPIKAYSLQQWQDAMKHSTAGFANEKTVFSMI